MLSRDQHDALVGRLYASALGDAPWLGTLQHISGLFRTGGAVLRLQDSAHRTIGVVTHPYSVEFAAEFYASEVGRNDPRLKRILALRPGTIFFDRAMYDVEEMNRDPRCRASNAAIGSKYSLGAISALPDGMTATATLLSTEAEGHASEASIRSFQRLAPHIAQALSLGQIVEHRASTQTALLDALARRADGVILLGRGGAPTFMNDTAQTILAAGDGLAFVDGAFMTRRGPETRTLRRVIGAALALRRPCETLPMREMLVTRTGGKRPYVLRVMQPPPTERFLTGLSISAVIHIHDLAAERLPSGGLLSAAFGLSEREADLAIELVRCANLAGAAANAHMALNTARNHLQSIFRKSGTNGQAEVVQLFTRMA